MNNNQFRKQEFEKRRVFKKGTSLCNAYSCPIFQNCLLEIKQLQQENARLKEFKKEHEIMKKILIEKGLWETLLNDDRFLEYLREEN